MLQRKHYVVTGSMCFQVELGRNLKLRLSDSNSLTAVSSRNFNSRDFPHRQPIYKEAVSSHLVLDCAFGGVHILTIFQQLSNDNVAAVVAPSVSILEAHNARRQAYKDNLRQGIVDPDIIDVTFNDFPYYSRYSYLVQQASGAKEVNTTIKESSRPERASVFAKRAPTSSVEADIVGGSITCSHAHQPKQKESTATSKTYTFKK
ncbi:hypothetical protein Tco_1240813, partial [Tanacetum coccineum]